MAQYSEGQRVEVRFPLTEQQARGDRDLWGWLAGEVEQQCGDDEYLVTVYDRRVAMLEDNSPAPYTLPDDEVYFPQCFRDSSELREVAE